MEARMMEARHAHEVEHERVLVALKGKLGAKQAGHLSWMLTGRGQVAVSLDVSEAEGLLSDGYVVLREALRHYAPSIHSLTLLPGGPQSVRMSIIFLAYMAGVELKTLEAPLPVQSRAAS